MRFGFLVAGLLMPLLVSADPCGFKVFSRGVWQAQQLPIDGGRRCFMKVSPKDGDEQDYRSFNFSSDGQIMIFVGIGAPLSSNTGARTYYLWPTEDVPRISKQKPGDKSTDIKTASGEIWTFDRSTQNVVGIDGCDYRYTSHNTWDEEGGVELLKCKNKLLVDTGFSRGKQTTQDPLHQATVTDPAGTRCRLQVRDLVDFSSGRDHPRLRFTNDRSLRDFLLGHPECGRLDLSMLAPKGLPLRAPASLGN